VRNVPTELNAFIGREWELTRLHKLQQENRLLTLVGPGGVGKTRLALKLEAELGDAFVDGSWLVDLSAITDPALVPQVLCDVLGIQGHPDESWHDELTRVIRPRHLLLVLDNCEHLIGACAALVEGLLQSCPRLSVLATSLQPLSAAGETIWRVPPLSVPLPSVLDLADLANAEAVRLFVARIRAHLPDFVVDQSNALTIAEICRRLDGLPLALELVAARVESLGLAEVAARLAQRFDLASGSTRTAPTRQRTLRATLEWSCRLLTDEELVVLRRLAVFAGGWTLEAAEAVCAGDEAPSGQPVIDILTRLVTKSLVVADHDAMRVRYRLLETVRAYALEQLALAGEIDELRQRHAAYMLELAERTPNDSINAARAALLTPEDDNVRAALGWAVMRDEAEVGLRLATAAFPMWMFSGHLVEGATWFDRLFELPTAARTAARTLALGHSGQLRLMLGDYDLAITQGETALREAHANDDALAIALITEMLGNVALQRGDLDQADALHTESAQRKRALGSPRLVSNLLQLGLIACEWGAFERVRELIVEIERFARGRNRPLEQAGLLNLRALLAASQGANTTAVRLFEEALELRRPAHDQQGIVKTLTSLGHVRFDLGEVEAALEAFVEAMHGARNSGERVRLIRALDGCARCLGRSDADMAVRLAGATNGARAALGTVAWPTEQRCLADWLGSARRTLGDSAYQSAWQDGHASTLEQAVSLVEALTVHAPPLRSPVTVLTPREQEVAALLGRGLTNKQIASALAVSPATIRSHVEHILMKLDLRSRAQIAVWASQQGLLS
jgi:predicted ATPase/DNA-binding CsgD family transcriptional regulator